MLAIKSSEPLAVGDGPALSAAQLATAVPAEGWVGPAPATAPKVEDSFQQAKNQVGLEPLRGPPLAGLGPAQHPGPADACLPGRHPQPGHPRRPRKGDAAA